jgi:hypothetical protein
MIRRPDAPTFPGGEAPLVHAAKLGNAYTYTEQQRHAEHLCPQALPQ